MVILAIILATLPPLFVGDFKEWLYKALIFLVVSCPCALVVSVPLSFFGGIGGASKKGILVKGSNFLEALSKVKIFAFDKTGTLTKGEIKVDKIVNESFISKSELLKYAALTQTHSSHPIAKSIIKAYGQNLDESLVTNLTQIPGQGIKAKV